VLNILAVTYITFGFLCYGIYSSAVMTFDMIMIIIWSLSTIGLVVLAYFVGGNLQNTTGKFRFIAIGLWHAILQVGVPVCLMLHTSFTNMLIISVATLAITHLAGYVFSHYFLGEDFTLEDQEKLGKLLFAAWGIVGICVLLSASWGNPVAVTGWRLLAAFLVGALFSCIWFGWYLAVSIAFHGHNNEAGGGSRSERYRHMIRFKLTKNTLTGYVIGIDEPVTDFAGPEPPKFRLVDVFTIQADNKIAKQPAKAKG
jgi:ABC-type multidrug transport system fused ATPase/permease subunit